MFYSKFTLFNDTVSDRGTLSLTSPSQGY